MYCSECGRSVVENGRFCDGCGAEIGKGVTAGTGGVVGGVGAATRDAWFAMRQVLIDPVGGLEPAFIGLGPERALWAGVVLCGAFALGASLGIALGAQQMASLLGPFGRGFFVPGVLPYLKQTLALLAFPAAIVAASLIVRRVARAHPPFAVDVFVAGGSVAPLGVAILVAGLLGVGSVEVVLLLLFVGVVYLVLMLFAGFTRVGGMSEKIGAPAVPAALLLSGWVAKIIMAALLR